MFYHKKLGWLTPTAAADPDEVCPPSSLPSGSARCTGACVLPARDPGAPAVCVLLYGAGSTPPAAPSAAGGPPACRGLSAPVLKVSESPTLLASCSPPGPDSDLWKEESIFGGDLPDLSGFLTPLPGSGEDSLRRQPACIPPPCPSHLPLCQDVCSSLCFIPSTVNANHLLPCAVRCGNALSRATGLPLARECAGVGPCAVKAASTCPCATKCTSALPCAMEIPLECTSTASCPTKGTTTIPYATKGTTTCPCATKCVSAMPCSTAIPSPCPCATKSGSSPTCATAWPSPIPCAPKCCCKRPTSVVPRIVRKWAGRCGIPGFNTGTACSVQGPGFACTPSTDESCN